ncbi:hypothetical protein PGTUg99_008064 [Puccinia graminis f. sp. tritici]|uniref:Uncharacterized protein n=1 Tax=Puccinia graminis f. sp. tritici TaxID=56615 RepID=A0A5B0S9K5_PUCGR|nr:hypothetical protein PGTUg99_008064 [Puccinia graminis f. sp. tritici]
MLQLAHFAFIDPSLAAEVNRMPEDSRTLHLRSTLNYSSITPPDQPMYDITVDVRGRRLPSEGGWLSFHGKLGVKAGEDVLFITVDSQGWDFPSHTGTQAAWGDGSLQW